MVADLHIMPFPSKNTHVTTQGQTLHHIHS